MSAIYPIARFSRIFILAFFVLLGAKSTNAQCNAAFTFGQPCPNAPVLFTDLSVAGAGDFIISWSWDFGDGGSSTLQNPVHTYAGPGNFLVTLCIQTYQGCSSCDTATVTVPYMPVADFAFDSCGCQNCPVQFTDLSTSQSYPIITWLWDFGDGLTSNSQNPCHLYDSTGIYNVTLTVCNSIGCSDDTTVSIEVFDLPVANFSYTSHCDYDVFFTDLSIANSYSLVSFLWDFGDGGTSTMQNPIHVYADSGTYLVSLTVINNNGCVDTYSQNVLVENAAVTDFADSSVCNNTYYFTDLSYTTGPGDSIIAWYWEFGDGATSTAQHPVHQYDSSATYSVILSVTTASGCGDSASNSIFVPTLTTADFTCFTDCDFTTYFTDLSQPGTGDSIWSWSWDFGDGITSTQQNPVHTYSAAGSYNVTLIVQCSCGNINTTSHEVVVYPPPDASFGYSAPAPDPGDVVYFTDQSSCADSNDYIVEWRWHFGDGDSTIVYYPDNPDVTHIYADTGMYMATLTVFDNDTCTGSITQGVNVNSTMVIAPLADFSFEYGCLNQYVLFTDLSSSNGGTPLVSWLWDFGDGGTSTLQSPQHMYSDTGYYDVGLVVTNTDNLSDTIMKTLYAAPLPEATVSAVPTYGSIGDTIQFYGNSGSNSIASWHWNFDDGNTSSLQNPIHAYQQNGLYDVSLTVTDTSGCMTTAYRLIRIFPPAYFPEDSTIWNTVGDNSISGDEWRFRYGMIGDTSISVTDLDTVYTYSKIYSLYDSSLSTLYSTYFAAVRVTDQDRVYALIPGFDETLLYDYTLEVGDTAWYSIGGALCYDGVEFWPENHYRVVTQIDSIELDNGDIRRRWHLGGGVMGDVWVMGIGSTEWYGLFNPLISSATYCGDSYTFACMKEGEEIIYLNNPHCDECFCDLLTEVDQPEDISADDVSVFPNPFSGKISIKISLSQPSSVRVEIANIAGIVVKEIPVKHYAAGVHQLIWNAQGVEPGIYFLRISASDRIYTRKIVKSR